MVDRGCQVCFAPKVDIGGYRQCAQNYPVAARMADHWSSPRPQFVLDLAVYLFEFSVVIGGYKPQ